MVPNPPSRTPSLGFLYLPPFRVQGFSVAGEETFVQIPELDVCFDIGRGHRTALTSNHVALSHGHMDHSAGVAYYFSQRQFQGMGVGTILCHMKLVEPLRALMNAWVAVEAQRTPYRVIGMEPGEATQEYEIKKGRYLRAFATDHTVPSLGFVVVERRSKLKEQYLGLPDEKIRDLKLAGEEITYVQEWPLVAYMGDTGPGSHFQRPDVVNATILITECTFLDADHRGRARIGKHLHLSDLAKLLPKMNNQHVVVTHLSRRTHLGQAREALDKALAAELRQKVHILMDNRTNRARYDAQAAESEPASPQTETT